MTGPTRLQELERQNKDLRVRLGNQEGKAVLELIAVKEENKSLKTQIREKDKTIAMLQTGYAPLEAENEAFRRQIETLTGENAALKDALEKAEDRAAKLAAMQKKDSSTSDKPPSSDPMFNKAKSNSSREKSGKKKGGQPGHKGWRLTPSPVPDVIVDKKPDGSCPDCCGDVVVGEDYEARQVIDIEVRVTVTEERSYSGQCAGCGKLLRGEFSKGFNSHVSYGPGVKAACAVLNADANVPVHKTAVFLSSLTEGRVNMSDGTVVNIVGELAGSLAPTIRDIAGELASCGVLNVDETGYRVNGDLTWIQIISSENYSLYGRSPKRGTPNEFMDGLLLLFTGVLVHDHLRSYYRYTHLTHAECNTHGLRYLKAVTEIMKHPWAKAMADLLTEANKRKKELTAAGATGMENEELDDIRKKYSDILAQGRLEYKAAIAGKKNITYYNEERRLLKRLEEYKDEHLRFLADFAVPFSNNGAEQGAYHLKRKHKTAGGFRSDGGVDNYAAIASVIATLRKQRKPIFPAVRSSFSGVPPSFGKLTASGFG